MQNRFQTGIRRDAADSGSELTGGGGTHPVITDNYAFNILSGLSQRTGHAGQSLCEIYEAVAVCAFVS